MAETWFLLVVSTCVDGRERAFLAHASETFVSRISRYLLEGLVGTNVDAKFQGLEGTRGAGSDVGRCRRGRVIMVGFAMCAKSMLTLKGGTGARGHSRP